MNLLKNLAGGAKKREASGPLTGRTLDLRPFTVRVEALIGEGGFATIYRAVDTASHEVYAVKHFRLSGDPEAERDVQVGVPAGAGSGSRGPASTFAHNLHCPSQPWVPSCT